MLGRAACRAGCGSGGGDQSGGPRRRGWACAWLAPPVAHLLPTCCPPVAHLLPTCCLSVAHLLLAGRLPHLEKGDRESLTVTDTWVNINRGRGDFNKLHSHVPAAYSGVYYAQPCSSGAGRLNGAFVLPISTVEASKGVQSEIAFSLMQPVRGMLLLFPATMLHAVLPSWTQGEERISIGFNVSPFW